jgi:ribosomal protein L16 Arg81 hydroxylase
VSIKDLASEMLQIDTVTPQRNDLANLFVNVEFRAVLKIRQKYCKWFESLIANTLQQSRQFVCEEPESQQDELMKILPDNAEPEMICTTTNKPNLRER